MKNSKQMKKYNIALVAAAMAFAGVAHAENLTTEIKVERTVETELPQASLLPSVYPAVQSLPVSTYRPQPTQYDRAVDFAPETGNTELPLNADPQSPDGRRGYVWAGYLPVYNAAIAAGYRLIDNGTTALGAAARFDGMSYKNKNRFNDFHMRDNSVGVKADFSHHFKKGYSIGADASYFYAGLKSPTLHGNALSQNVNAADVALKFAHTGSVPAYVTARYDYFGLGKDVPTVIFDGIQSLPHASDSRLLVEAGVALPLTRAQTSFFDIDVYTDFLNAKGVRWLSSTQFATPDYSFSGIVGILPGVRFSYRQVDIKLGAKINMGVNSPGSVSHVAPNINLTWRPSGYLGIYGTFGGGERFHTLAEQYQLSSFAPSVTASSRSYTPVDGRVGFHLRPINNLYAGMYVGYAATERMPMLTVLNADVPVFLPVNLSGWNFGFDAKYKHGKLFEADASLRLYAHSYNSGSADAPDRAKVVMKLGAKAYPMPKLTVSADYTLRACRRYYVLWLDGALTPMNMHNISDLSLGGEYEVERNLSVFLRLENILCRRALVLPHIEQQSFHGLLGAQYRF